MLRIHSIVNLRTLAALALVSAFVGVALVALGTNPVITTDATYYLPFSTVSMTASGMTAGVSYDVETVRPDGSVVTGAGTDNLIPPAPYDTVVADSTGNFSYSYQLTDFSGLYTVNVYETSDTSHANLIATTTFWDPTLSQCANGNPPATTCAWQFGDLNGSNSQYAESQVIPFRWEVSGLTPGSTHTVHINYDFSKGGPKGYDFLTAYNITETGANVCGAAFAPLLCPVAGTPPVQPPQCFAFPVESFTAPTPLNVSGAIGFSGLTTGQRCLGVYGASINSLSTPVHSPNPWSASGNGTGDLTVSFTVKIGRAHV